ncbi:hypothetical protein GIB67_037526 [Kingdonia uniflora]|uniref:Kinesin-like protein n=1 Tax=Kingdonia uniflora TaxID=39325 RepID=A0A7J7NAT2_9MAGN|nr:hypothetical protein GIB67_037526 [Kingdonia uniflora]
MKVTFLELYNEELTDLLATEDSTKPMEDKQRKPISLMEDGKGGVIVRGLEEEVVYSANEIYTLLERGSAKRRTVDTLLNKHSSRSHSVFSITIHVKEATVDDEDLIKCGKLNLVDLAGSENISRSGARESRAREAGEINKSLLTLGRVINALVEHSAHVPYRDSKLTRLLRDSLGGKTKTCIIATISPSPHSLEETLSTLDYAYRAKSIKNKPEVNQKISKTILLKDLYLEMEKMKQDVRAAREKNGVYIPHERFVQDEVEKKAMFLKIEQLEIDLDLKGKTVDKFRELYLTEQESRLDLQSKLDECKINLDSCNKSLQELQVSHKIAISTLKEKEFIISNLLHSENSILERAKELCSGLSNASEDITALYSKIDHKNKKETENHRLVMNFGSQLDRSLRSLHETVLVSVYQQQQQLQCVEEHMCSFLASKCDVSRVLESRIEKIRSTYTSGVRVMKELDDTLQKKSSSNLEQIKSTICAQTMAVENFLITAVSKSEEIIRDIKNSLDEQKQLATLSAQQQEEGLQRSLVSTQVISEATTDFFNDLCYHSSKFLTTIEQNFTESSQKLSAFEKIFQEQSAREEKLAVEKIAAILRTLTSNKTYMVSKAMRNMDTENTEVKIMLEQEMVNIQNISADARKEWKGYIEKVESQFVDDTFSAAETKAAIESNFQECSNKVDSSRKHWEDAQLSINQLIKCNTAEIESIVADKCSGNQVAFEKFVSVSLSTDAKFNSRACDLLTTVNESLQLDHEAIKEIESLSHLSLDQLISVQDNHGEGISGIRNNADQCLRKEYSVDDPTSRTPEKRTIAVPTLASIEELRTPALDELVANMRSSTKNAGGKIQQKQQHKQQTCTVSPNRAPFASVNL